MIGPTVPDKIGSMDERLRRSERITRRKEIDEVRRLGRRWTDRLLRFHVKENGLPFPRIAISVPRRIGGAVLRNRWKRLIREAFRKNKGAIGPGLDILAVPRRPPAGVKRQHVESAMLQILRRNRRS